MMYESTKYIKIDGMYVGYVGRLLCYVLAKVGGGHLINQEK